MDSIRAGQPGKMNDGLQVGEIVTRLDEASSESSDFAIVVKDSPPATPSS
jgi:hypothetical protein